MAYPIILAHGICRFDHLLNATFGLDNQDDDGLHYFRHIRSALRVEGYEVYHSCVGWADPLHVRSRQLKDQLAALTGGFQTHAKVHIIAHSMGGLDARRMIVSDDMADRVASLTTIGTPHHGSSFADWGVERLGWALEFLRFLGVGGEGVADLTTERCRAFNAEAEKVERGNGVHYQSFAGVLPRERIFRPLRLPYDVIADREGPNDGLVSVASARWRDDVFAGQIEADHLGEVGWFDPTDPVVRRDGRQLEDAIRRFYVDVARSL